MKMFTATRIAALAVGLSLAGGQAFADPSDGHGRRNNDNASDQQNSNDQNDGGTYRKKQAAPATKVNQNPVVVAPVQPTIQTDGRRQDRAPRQTNNKRGDSNDQNWRRDRRDSHPVARSDNRRGDWRNQGRLRYDVTRHNRNVDAARRFHVDRYRQPYGYSYRRWNFGQHLPRGYYVRRFWLTNFLVYGLFAPPPGYIWVRYGPDALLIDEYTGEIVQVQYNMFYS